MVEALAAATPVIAYGQAGATEIVTNGENGILFEAQTIEALNRAVDLAKTTDFKPDIMRRTAKRFDQAVFSKAIKEYVSRAYSQYVHPN